HGAEAFLSPPQVPALVAAAQVADEPRERAIVELIETSLRANSSIELRAQGGSMMPAIWPGDVLTIIPAQMRYPAVDEVALVRVGNTVRAHRVMRRGANGGLQTRGDALRHSDPYVDRSSVLGTAVARNGRPLARGRARWGVVAALRRMAYREAFPVM